MSWIKSVRIVLVEPSHGGNIGAVARAMKNMGLTDLGLVKPNRFLSPECLARASGADDLIQKAQIYPDLDAAIADRHWVIGSTARLRSVSWPQYDPRQAAAEIRSRIGQKTAILFGREKSGLSNRELDRCHALLHIPTAPEYPSLNLAMAVQIVCYELKMTQAPSGPSCAVQPASADEMNGFFNHLEQMMQDIGFSEQPSTKLMRRLKRLFLRAELRRDEIQILRGIFSAAQGRKSAR